MSNGIDRRNFLRSSAALSAGGALAACAPGMGPGNGFGTGMAPVLGMEDPPISSLAPPGQRQGNYADLNGARIFYQESGQGHPIILVHGYPLSGALFSRVRDALADDYRVITLDQRGYGQSRAPGVPDSIGTYAGDVLALMDRLDIPSAIIGGHSMGGPITLETYKRAPQRFRGMILIDTIAAPASPIEKGLWMGFADEVKQNGISQTYVDSLIKDMLSGDTRVQQPQQVDYLSAVVKQSSTDAAIGGAMALANRPDYRGMLGSIRVPTMVYVGVEDSIYPVKISKMMNQAIPSSTLVTIPGAAHAAVFEAPDRSREEILRWADGIA